jgi:hypothetical protein
MMVDEFTVEIMTTEAIKVRHVAHCHRFTFHVCDQLLPLRTLRVGWVQANENASLPSAAFKASARAFAEREARKAGLID